MQTLLRDDVGRPVPFFVAYIDDKPDFRVVDPVKLRACLMQARCWVCGKHLDFAPGSSGVQGTFVAGPMCLVNRTSAEPPSHHECGVWSAKACPFLFNPEKHRREAKLPEAHHVAGVMIPRNPQTFALINAIDWSPFRAPGGVLVHIDRVKTVEWMTEGREATADEVLRAMDTGLPTLYDLAEEDGSEALQHLCRMTLQALRFVPDDASVTGYENIERAIATPLGRDDHDRQSGRDTRGGGAG